MIENAVCEEVESEIFENINLEGGNISEENPELGIPDGNDFRTVSAEECLARCLEYPSKYNFYKYLISCIYI